MSLSSRLTRFPVSLAIALLSLVAFALELANDPVGTSLGRVTLFDIQFSFIPAFVGAEPWRWLTAPFLHVAPWHLLNNVGFVLILGTWLEEDIGPLRLAALFALGALTGEAYYLIAGDDRDIVLGASAGLMAIAGAAIVMERKAAFAAHRQRLAGLAIVLTIALSIAAPALGALGAHVTGALVGMGLGLVLPAPLRLRGRRVLESERREADWNQTRAALEPASGSDVAFRLRPTVGRTAAVAVTVVLVVVTGCSIGLQSVFLSDTTSAVVAAVAAVWTFGAAALFWFRLSAASVVFDSAGIAGGRLRKTVQWSEIETLYPGRVLSGLFAQGAIGFIRHDGKRFAVLGAGHKIRPLACQIERIRLAALKAAATTGGH